MNANGNTAHLNALYLNGFSHLTLYSVQGKLFETLGHLNSTVVVNCDFLRILFYLVGFSSFSRSVLQNSLSARSRRFVSVLSFFIFRTFDIF